MSDDSRLAHFPIAFFAMVMGLAGWALSFHRAEVRLGLGVPVGDTLLVVTAGVFLVLLTAYLTKLLRHREAVLAEWNNPVKLSFFPTLSISLILLGTGAAGTLPGVATALLSVGVVLQLVFTLAVLSAWIYHEHFEVHHSNPAWFIPVVGNILVPIAGARLLSVETSWFFFSVGIVFWLVLFTILMYRIVFLPPLPAKLVPTMAILVAPPAAGFIAYVSLTGGLDPFARVLYYTALFLTLLQVVHIRRFTRLAFTLSWWAYSFPLAAVTIATLVMADLTGLALYAVLGYLLLAFLTAVMVLLVVRTVMAVRRHGICVPEG